jgi:cobalt-precorrin 5A hydrolase
MGVDEARDKAVSLPLLAIGIGCKSGVCAEAVINLVGEACRKIEGEPNSLYTAEEKRAEPAVREAAAYLGLPLIYLSRDSLKAEAGRAATTSQRVLALFGVPSIAETAALAGAGPGSKLLLTRISANGVTCAIAAQSFAIAKEII